MRRSNPEKRHEDFTTAISRESLKRIAVGATLKDLPDLAPTAVSDGIDWNFSLLCASALTSVELEEAQDRVNRCEAEIAALGQTVEAARQRAAEKLAILVRGT